MPKDEEITTGDPIILIHHGSRGLARIETFETYRALLDHLLYKRSATFKATPGQPLHLGYLKKLKAEIDDYIASEKAACAAWESGEKEFWKEPSGADIPEKTNTGGVS